MGRKKQSEDRDRFLIQRSGNYYYKRRVPAKLGGRDARAPFVRIALGTDDVALARQKRDALAQADDALWASLLLEADRNPALARYQAAVKRVEAMGFTYRSNAALAATAPLAEVAQRMEYFFEGDGEAWRRHRDVGQALLGQVKAPPVAISKAFEIYCDEIVPDELLRKSDVQKKQWKKVKQRAVNNFIDILGDKAMADITRDDAKRIYTLWRERIAPKGKAGTHSPSSGNRDIGNLRVLYDAYFKHLGDEERKNPFAGLGFVQKKKRSRPPFPIEWIETKILRAGALATLNEEARGIVLALIETGARPSEIANLQPSSIRLSHKVPHLAIEPRDDPDDPREIKTASSERLVPLVGVALEVFKRHKTGFPRYQNRENELSATLNKYFKTNGLFPSPQHKIYSIRHSFEDRMKEGNLDEELRRILMGHTIDRPKYGSGGSLEWRRDQMLTIALKFDAGIV